MRTTVEDLHELYDDAVALLRERIKDKSATAADFTNLLRLLDKVDLLNWLKASAAPGSSAAPLHYDPADLPFPTEDPLELADLAQTGIR